MDSENEKPQNFEFVVNHRHFITAVVSIMDTLKDKSIELMETSGSKAKYHDRLQKCCDKILVQYRSDTDNLNEGKIIKKVYKTLRDNLTLLRDKDGALFTVKDSDNKIMTIIPGIDIGLIYKNFEEEEKAKFWQFMYLMFISSVKMIHSANETKMHTGKNKEIFEHIESMEKELTRTGLTVRGMAFNPFVGLDGVSSKDEFGVNELYSGDVPKQAPMGIPGVDINMVLQQLGIQNVVDIDKINDQLKNITEAEIQDATQNITNIIGASDDPDVADVCNTLVRSIVENLKENGISDMMGTLQSISQSVGDKIDPTKMQKTANTMNGFMQNSESQLRNMKDESGNNIGEKLFAAMGNPLNMAKEFSEGKMPQMPQMPQMNTTSRDSSESTEPNVTSDSAKTSVKSKKNRKSKNKNRS